VEGLPPPPTTPDPGARWGMPDIVLGLLVVVAANVAMLVVLVVAYLITGDAGTAEEADDGPLQPWAIALGVLVNAVGFVGWPLLVSRWKGSRSLRRDFGLAITPGDVGLGVAGFVVLLFWQGAAGLAWYALSGGDETPTNTDFLSRTPGPGGVLVIVVAVAVVTPIAEELFFRGLALRAVARRWGRVWGVAVSSVLFGLMHALGLDLATAAFVVVVTAGFGVVFGFLAAWRRRLGAAIVAHGLVNALAITVALSA
jgi:membrane protease YdiL (CAAX protease family)